MFVTSDEKQNRKENMCTTKKSKEKTALAAKKQRDGISGISPKRFSGRFRVRPRFARAVSYLLRVLVWRSAATPLVIDKHTPWCQIYFI